MLDLTYLFCIYSFLGWVVEVVFFYFKTKEIQKRGILSGPYCPLYGFSLAVCTVLISHIDNILIGLVICGFVCTSFELITGIVFDKILGRPMWDYTCCRFNLNGYICLTFSIIWSVVALLCVKLLNPLILSAFDITKLAASIGIITFMSTDVLTKVKQ